MSDQSHLEQCSHSTFFDASHIRLLSSRRDGSIVSRSILRSAVNIVRFLIFLHQVAWTYGAACSAFLPLIGSAMFSSNAESVDEFALSGYLVERQNCSCSRRKINLVEPNIWLLATAGFIMDITAQQSVDNNCQSCSLSNL